MGGGILGELLGYTTLAGEQKNSSKYKYNYNSYIIGLITWFSSLKYCNGYLKPEQENRKDKFRYVHFSWIYLNTGCAQSMIDGGNIRRIH